MKANKATIQLRAVQLWVPVILSALVGAVFTFFALGAIVDQRSTTGQMGNIAALTGSVLLVLGILELLVAFGLWRLKSWGWVLGVSLDACMLLFSAMIAPHQETMRPYLLLFIAALLVTEVFLFTPQVRRLFRS